MSTIVTEWPRPPCAGGGNIGAAAAGAVASRLLSATLAVYEAAWGRRWQALVLTGSLARQEEAWTGPGGRWLRGDAELLAVFAHRRHLPPRSDRDALQRRLQQALGRDQIQAAVEVSPVTTHFLRRLGPELFACELRLCGQVLAGDRGVLRQVPVYGAAEIALEDGWRLLAHRLLEWLEARCTCAARYALSKLYADMGTSRLIFEHGCEPGYRRRRRRLRAWAEQAEPPWRGWAERVLQATAYKLGEAELAESVWQELNRQALADAGRLWTWERAQMAGGGSEELRVAQLANWYRRQPARARVRGWLAAARAAGGAGWRRWPAWLSRGWPASPRYWVYAGLERLLIPGEGPAPLPPWLPLPASTPGWESALAENYRRLLVGTRS